MRSSDTRAKECSSLLGNLPAVWAVVVTAVKNFFPAFSSFCKLSWPYWERERDNCWELRFPRNLLLISGGLSRLRIMMRWRKTWSKMRSLQSDHFQRAFTARARARADLKVKPETMIFKKMSLAKMSTFCVKTSLNFSSLRSLSQRADIRDTWGVMR